MQIQNGLRKNSSLSKFVVGAHPIIEHFIEMLRIREIISQGQRAWIGKTGRLARLSSFCYTILQLTVLGMPHVDAITWRMKDG